MNASRCGSGLEGNGCEDRWHTPSLLGVGPTDICSLVSQNRYGIAAFCGVFFARTGGRFFFDSVAICVHLYRDQGIARMLQLEQSCCVSDGRVPMHADFGFGEEVLAEQDDFLPCVANIVMLRCDLFGGPFLR